MCADTEGISTPGRVHRNYLQALLKLTSSTAYLSSPGYISTAYTTHTCLRFPLCVYMQAHLAV